MVWQRRVLVIKRKELDNHLVSASWWNVWRECVAECSTCMYVSLSLSTLIFNGYYDGPQSAILTTSLVLVIARAWFSDREARCDSHVKAVKMTSVDDTDHLDGKVFNSSASPQVNTNVLFPQQRIHPEYLPGGRKSLAGISSHAFGLGIALGLCSLLSGQLAYHSHYLWRVPFFITILAIFHFLEFYITARYNPPDARVSSYLLFSNGRAYNIAHTAAVVEALMRSTLR